MRLPKLRELCLTILIIGVHFCAEAGFKDGVSLEEKARAFDRINARNGDSVQDPMDASYYIGYVLGVHDALSGTGSFCPPENFTINEATAIVRRYLRQNPGQLNKTADTLVVKALAQAFPCNR